MPVGTDTLVDVPRPKIEAPNAPNGAAQREAAAPTAAIHDAPTAPPAASSKNKKKKDRQRTRSQPPEPDATIPFSKISVPPPAPPSQSASPSAPLQSGETSKKNKVGKLAPAAAAGAHPKEPVFSDVDEEFFAKEAELHKLEPVETFEDLDLGAKGKPAPKRGWFGWGEKPTKKK